MAHGNLNFISPLKIVAIDIEKNPPQYGSFETGKICGSSLTRTKVQTKQYDFKKYPRYTLKDNLETAPKAYTFHYQLHTEQLESTFHQVKNWYLNENISLNSNDIKTRDVVKYELPKVLTKKPTKYSSYYRCEVTQHEVKNVKNIWKLKEPVYFYWETIENLPMEVTELLEPAPLPKKGRNTWENRPTKVISPRTRSKIESKLMQWHSTVIEKYEYNPEKVNFYFLTFTVTQPNFSHEQTTKAWHNFLTNIKHKFRSNKNPFNYLWVVELQDRRKYKLLANEYMKMGSEDIKNEFTYTKKAQTLMIEAEKATNNLHYHMIVDRFLDVKELQRLWLDSLEFYGSTRYTSTGANANPVDARKMGNSVESMGRYMSKYVSKSDVSLKCQLWHCSRPISKMATSLADCRIALKKIHGFYEAMEAQTRASLHYVKQNFEKAVKQAMNMSRKILDNGNVIFYFKKQPKWLKTLCKPLTDFNMSILFPPPTPLFLAA